MYLFTTKKTESTEMHGELFFLLKGRIHEKPKGFSQSHSAKKVAQPLCVRAFRLLWPSPPDIQKKCSSVFLGPLVKTLCWKEFSNLRNSKRLSYLQISKKSCIFAVEKDVFVGSPRISVPKTQLPIVSFDSIIATFDSTIVGCDCF